ncbi:MAG: aminodeoxychorismate synthase component I [Pseudomonadota bacterium]
MSDRCIVFDHGPSGGGVQFSGPLDIITAATPEQVPAAFAALEAAHAKGHWLAGMASYELGYALIDKLQGHLPSVRKTPLLQFGVFAHGPQPATPFTSPAVLPQFTPLWDFARYKQAFQTVHDYIAAGDIYQANLTFPLQAKTTADPRALYAALVQKQPVPHGAYVDLGGPVLLSRSPELFFSRTEDGILQSRPMKGTAPRDGDADTDLHLRDSLWQSKKNRAENLMIVDLLRNDMSRVSKVGSVKVPDLFHIESYTTVHQMTSRIQSQMLPDVTLFDLFAALFPCGSITGAPKIRAMEILRDVEHGARDAYCGGIGWIAPDGAMEFNVAIRTILAEPDGTLTLNVGGGIVYDSTAHDEYNEALLKSSFAQG